MLARQQFKKVTLLLVPVGQKPQSAEVLDHWEEWREIVARGRTFTVYHITPTIGIVCADDASDVGFEANSCGLYGPYFFVRIDHHGHSRSLTPKQLEKCRRLWKECRDIAPLTLSSEQRLRLWESI